MKWDQQKYIKTIPIDPRNNCFTFRSTSGTNKFTQAQSLIHEEIGYNSNLVEQCIICNDVTSTRLDVDEYSEEENLHEFVEGLLGDKDESKIASIMKDVEKVDENLTSETDQAEFMRWHYRLGHLPYKKLKILAVMGLIPKRILNVKPPKCAGCIFGKMTKRPWRTKATVKQGLGIFKATKSGQCVSVDQMESTEDGFVAQLKGKLTRRRYKYATIFVDHYSDLSYVHLQSTITSDETLQAKHAFEAYARSMEVKILRYHADNGRFAVNMFINDVEIQGQSISYCGI